MLAALELAASSVPPGPTVRLPESISTEPPTLSVASGATVTTPLLGEPSFSVGPLTKLPVTTRSPGSVRPGTSHGCTASVPKLITSAPSVAISVSTPAPVPITIAACSAIEEAEAPTAMPLNGSTDTVEPFSTVSPPT